MGRGALNHALRGLPEEQIRLHTCYSIDMVRAPTIWS
jgi:hypothetical protein